MKIKNNKKTYWVRSALQIRGSVIAGIYKRVISVGIFGFFISILYYLKYPVSQPIFGTIIPSIVLGLLLVFRTNTAYERFWEGRRLWGNFTNDCRNLAWNICVMMNDVKPEDRAKKIALLRLVIAFPVACKLSLRGEAVNEELEALMSPSQYLHLKNIRNRPLAIIAWIGDYLQHQYQRGNSVLHYSHIVFLQSTLKSLIESLGNCERIVKTPLPLAYAIHLKQLILIYCLLLPFQLVKDVGWGTGVIVALISFTLFGIEEIGCEIENPFGYDANDLPIDAICLTIQNDIEDFITWNLSNQSDVNGYTDEIDEKIDVFS